LEAVSQRSNLTSSNSRHDRHGRDDGRSTSTHSPRPVFDIDGQFFSPQAPAVRLVDASRATSIFSRTIRSDPRRAPLPPCNSFIIRPGAPAAPDWVRRRQIGGRLRWRLLPAYRAFSRREVAPVSFILSLRDGLSLLRAHGHRLVLTSSI